MIGILPAAGEAKRMHGIPKYLLPTRNGYLLKRHLEMMAPVCNRRYVLTNPHNDRFVWSMFPEPDATLFIQQVHFYKTMSETVLNLKDNFDTEGEDVLFGMPDTYIEGDINYYAWMASNLSYNRWDVVTGIFVARPDQHQRVGMVRPFYTEDNGYTITEVIDKPETTDLQWGWGSLAWKPSFWEYIQPDDPHIGYALQRAIGKLKIGVIRLGDYWDCGTPDEYFDLIRHLTEER